MLWLRFCLGSPDSSCLSHRATSSKSFCVSHDVVLQHVWCFPHTGTSRASTVLWVFMQRLLSQHNYLNLTYMQAISFTKITLSSAFAGFFNPDIRFRTYKCDTWMCTASAQIQSSYWRAISWTIRRRTTEIKLIQWHCSVEYVLKS
jgi:hypothetical protein